METDHLDCPILPLRIRHECTGARRDLAHRQRGWRFKEYIVNLGGLTAGRDVEVNVDLPNSSGVRINGVTSLNTNALAILVSTHSIAHDISSCRVRFTPSRGYQGMLYAMVMFQSDTGNKDIAFIARVQP